jgi:LAO/AO transport system kinase
MRAENAEHIVRGVMAGDRRAVARAITLVENEDPVADEIVHRLPPQNVNCKVVGLTGSPGVGKSTLTDVLIRYLRTMGQRVGVIAVDPSSPFTGGAILGDRIRMNAHALDPEVFIRSMGTRGSLGGLSRSTRQAIRILEAYGCDTILVETVGVGQSELDVMYTVQTVVVVTSPAAGDQIQAAKAGIMEIADVFVVNKADLPGVQRTVMELEQMLDVSPKAWRPPIVQTILPNYQNETGFAPDDPIAKLWNAICEHHAFLQTDAAFEIRQNKQTGEWMYLLISQLEKQIRQSQDKFRRYLQEQQWETKDYEDITKQIAKTFVSQFQPKTT